jgi:cellulose/xylan binding protein with CBM9 domain
MKNIAIKISIVSIVLSLLSCSGGKETKKDTSDTALKEIVTEKSSTYHVARTNQSMTIDADWDKSQWQNIESVEITNYMGEIPAFRPVANAKMVYDDNNIYVIFQVQDRYVRCLTNKINGPVWEDSAVEFFFAPDSKNPERYFNLETNCGGTALLHYNLVPRKKSNKVETEEIEKIEIAHSLPQLIDPEMTDPVIWTLEYRIPFIMLEKYSKVTRPGTGVVWRANFYKIAENSSNPHYITWSVIENSKPNFHLPQFFGKLEFK